MDIQFISLTFRQETILPFNIGPEMFATRSRIPGLSPARICTLPAVLVAGLLLLCSHAQADIQEGGRLYRENCAPCHGESGKGDGIGARSLPVRPADHTNGGLMKSRSDAFLRDVIAKGGSAMGLSSFMPAWQGVFKETEIRDLVGYIRSLASSNP